MARAMLVLALTLASSLEFQVTDEENPDTCLVESLLYLVENMGLSFSVAKNSPTDSFCKADNIVLLSRHMIQSQFCRDVILLQLGITYCIILN